MSPEASLGKAVEVCRKYDYFALYVTGADDFTLYLGAEEVIQQATGNFESLKRFQQEAKKEICGYLGYDLKNDLEDLRSENQDPMVFPEASFFVPQYTLRFEKGNIECDSERLYKDWINAQPQGQEVSQNIKKPLPSTDRDEYLRAANAFKAHLQRGDIYEANYCIQFTAETPEFDPFSGFYALQKLTEAPFSVFSRLGNYFVLSASPERYLKRQGQKLISQPIKGTAKRYSDSFLDEKSQALLQVDPKERSENVMIVDLVRNDLSRIAERGSVQVSELFGVHSFKTVHHLISTVEARLKDGFDSWDAIKATFPMGSMTGAPKISAMNLIERYENFKRGAYSGAFGVIKPNGDFDFNVLIRTLLFNSESKVLGFGVGSAITIQAHPEKEYEECLLKAEALIRSLREIEHETTRAVQD